MTQHNPAFLLKLSDGGTPAVYRTVAGLRAGQFTLGQSTEIVGVGIMLGSEAEAQVKALALNQTEADCQLSFDDGSKIDGAFIVAEYSLLGGMDGEATYRIKLTRPQPTAEPVARDANDICVAATEAAIMELGIDDDPRLVEFGRLVEVAATQRLTPLYAHPPAPLPEPVDDGLVERLRTTRLLSQRNQFALQDEAAEAIQSLRAEIARLQHDLTITSSRYQAVAAEIARQPSMHMIALFEGPCPICNGVEGCDHAVAERARAYVNLQAEIARKDDALRAVEDAMLRRGDGAIGDYGWNITKLNKARPTIRAALNPKETNDE